MPEYALWSLIVALIMLALGLALKVAQLRNRLDDVSKKHTHSESEFQSFQKQKNEEITNIKELHNALINGLNDKIFKLSHAQSELSQSIIKDFTIEDLIWTATNSDLELYVDDCPRCKIHDLKLLHDSYYYFCPESLNNNCQYKIPLLSLRDLKKIAISYIEKAFRDNTTM